MKYDESFYFCHICGKLWDYDTDKCPECGNPFNYRVIEKSVFRSFRKRFGDLKTEGDNEFKEYQKTHNDYKDGSYGRFIADRYGLPNPPVDAPLWDNFDEIIEEMGWNFK